MKHSGDSDYQGNQIKNYKDEVLAAKPVYQSPADDGRPIWISTIGADYGPWVGSEDAGDWVRPGSFGGGGGGGYIEPGLLCWLEPIFFQEWNAGFSLMVPALLYTNRPLLLTPPLEFVRLLMQYDTDGLGTPGLLPPGIDLVGASIPYGDLFFSPVWFDAGLFGFSSIMQMGGYASARLVIQNAAGQYLDGLTVDIQNAPL